MVEAKLFVGKFLRLSPAASMPLTGNAPAFVTVHCPVLHIEESVRVDLRHKLNPFGKVGGRHESAVSTGALTSANKVHRNFKWLPWYQGDISETQLTHDVLTGPMSGCTLVTYRKVAGGPVFAGHLGTVDASANATQVNPAVKNLWNVFAAANQALVIGGFNPVGINVPAFGPPQPKPAGDAFGVTWGLYTTTGQFYAVQVWRQINTTDLYRVAAIHSVNSMSYTELCNL